MFTTTPEQRDLCDVVGDFGDRETGGRADGGPAAAPHDGAQWARMADLGLTGIGVPAELGGADLGPVELALVAEELGARVFGGPFLGSAVLAATALRAAGGARARELLSGLAAGRCCPTLVAGPAGVPWSLAGVTVRAADGADGPRLSGEVPVVWDGGGVDCFLVVATTGAGTGLFEVALAGPGVTVLPLESLDPSRSASRLVLDGAPAVVLAADAEAAVEAALEAGRLAVAAELLGSMRSCLRQTVAYARTRVQFGRPIGSFQAVQHRLADLHVRIELCRSSVSWAAQAARPEVPVPGPWPAAALSLCADTARLVAAETIQLHGGIGFTWEHDAHRHARRAEVAAVLFGDPQAQRRRVADLLLGAPAASPVACPVASPDGHEDVRAQVRSWLDEHLPPDWAPWFGDVDESPDAAELGRRGPWFRALGDAGWSVPTWPVAHGGRGLSLTEGRVVVAELARRGAGPNAAHWTGLTLAAAALLSHGTEEQRQRLLPGIRRGTQRWCQLFSEPGAGSDLASLATSAVRRPDGTWLVNGQKVWSTFAQHADFGILLARTHPERPKHAGITFFVVDMRQPGIEVRPLRQMTGDAHFNEVFFTDVVVPDDLRVGAPGEGWSVAMATLVQERTNLVGAPAVGPGTADAVVEVARASGRWADPVTRDRLVAELVVERALQATALRAEEERAAGTGGAGGASSVAKLARAELAERLGGLALVAAGPDALAWPAGTPRPPSATRFLGAKAHSLAGGTTEIQRSIIAQRVLGLPRDPDPDRHRPWRDSARAH